MSIEVKHFYSKEAETLKTFANTVFWTNLAAGVLVLIFSMFEKDKWGDPTLSGVGFFTGLLWCGGITFVGYGIKLILNGFAVIVEASSRRIK